MEPTLRSAHVLKQEAEDLGYEGKEILEYVKEQQALDREERAAWRDVQKMQKQASLRMPVGKRTRRVIKLSTLLTGKATDVYTRMSDADAIDYNKLKKALLTRYNYIQRWLQAKIQRS